MPNWKIRPWTPDDAEALKRMWCHLCTSAGEEGSPEKWYNALPRFLPGYIVFILEVEHDVVGFIDGYPIQQAVQPQLAAVINSTWVDPPHRRHSGLLLRTIREHLKSFGSTHVFVSILPSLVKFWKKHKFSHYQEVLMREL